MEEMERLIGRLDHARRTMQALLAEVNIDREIYPQWTIKEILAHIAGWDDVVTAALEAHASGQVPTALPVKGIDAYNRVLVQACEALTYDQVVKNWKLARSRLKASLSEIPAGKVEETMTYPWGSKGSVARAIAILADHEQEHAAEIRELVMGPAPDWADEEEEALS
jgi:hypothetical protein